MRRSRSSIQFDTQSALSGEPCDDSRCHDMEHARDVMDFTDTDDVIDSADAVLDSPLTDDVIDDSPRDSLSHDSFRYNPKLTRRILSNLLRIYDSSVQYLPACSTAKAERQ